MSGTASVVPNGDNIAGMAWTVPLQFHLDPSVSADAAGPYIPIPGAVTINIDDISFIQERRLSVGGLWPTLFARGRAKNPFANPSFSSRVVPRSDAAIRALFVIDPATQEH